LSFILDTDICSAYLKSNRAVSRKLMLHFGALSMSTVTLGELTAWGLRRTAPLTRLQEIQNLVKAVDILPVNSIIARRFGQIRAELLDRGLRAPVPDLFIAATALEHQLTVVTHNTQDYVNVPGLTLEDWYIP